MSLTGVLAGEWTKVRSLRSMAYGALLALAMGAGFGMLTSYAAGRDYARSSAEARASFDPAASSLRVYLSIQLVLGILGVLTITSEYASGTIRASLGAVPRRSRLLAAKVAVFTAGALVLGQLVALLAFLVGQPVMAAQGAPSTTLGAPGVLLAVVGAGLVMTAVGVLGVALGVLTRSTAAGLITVAVLTVLVPSFIPALPEPLSSVLGRYWPTTAAAQLTKVVPDAGALDGWAGLGLLAALVSAALAAAFVVFGRRDV
ncbi:ABC transporter permease subunit [Micromonospora sp. WMMD975]|uniref:ABC transporter permease subunit n=1 Tax=Micromonospora sp. WMMD975 TaxID=3016087 RepID=UPI00249A8478|nr:ABC transporter permease subunit [Micromonospora sp. WMMD975]WFE35223.1 ABC transporter permease subunit [Micromonospora sp. WMMD975]